MGIFKDGQIYKVESSKPGRFYEVNLQNRVCTCPHFVHRLQKARGECKHIQAVKKFVTGGKPFKYDELIKYVEDNVFVDSTELIEKFGEEVVNELIEKAELIEEQGKIRLL